MLRFFLHSIEVIMPSFLNQALRSSALLLGVGLVTSTPALASDVNPIFGQAAAQKTSVAENKAVKGKGAQADLYGYYGNYYNNAAGQYGMFGAYYRNSSYYATASTYASYASTYYGYASSYQAAGQ